MLIFNQTLTIKTRLWLNFGLVISILSGIGIFVLIQMQALTDTTNKLYKHPYTVTKSIKEVDTNLNQMRNHLLTLLLDKDASHLNSQIAAIDAIKNDVQVKSTLIKERFLGDQQEVNALIVEFNKLTELREKTIQLLKSGNLDQAIEFALGGDHSKQFELVVQQINKIENFANNKAESFMNNAQLQSRQIRIVTITIITVAIGLIWWMMFFLFRAINRPLSQAVEIADAISGGNFDNQIIIKTKDEIGQLLEALSCMQTQLRTRLEEDNRIAEEINAVTQLASQGDFSQRLQVESKKGMFKVIADSINQVLIANQLAIQDLIHVFAAVAQGDLTKTITNNYQGELAKLKQDANATVQKLTQVTEEIGIATRTASQGDFSKRINLENKTGTFRLLGESINQVLDYNQLAIKDLTRVFSAVAQGNLTETIINNYQGELAQLKQDANATVQKLTLVTEEIAEVTHAAAQGNFGKRIALEKKTGTFRILGESINQVLDYNQLAIKDLMRVFAAIAQGNLTQTITNDYSGELAQLKQDANATVAKLMEVMGIIKQSSTMVNHAAGELSQANANLSQRATQQAASLEETAASMQQMTGTVQQNSENAKQANLLANNARERAELGNQVVNTAVVAINEISKSSKKIGEIVSVIDEIAFQTNLLALNAAVEAARAGEQGRGFAVVATEVRTLAQRSATAAKEIKALIQDSNLKMDEGIRLGNQSGQTLTEIVMAVKKVNDIISEIAAASIEQSQGIEQVNKAITQMDEMVEQNSALVEQTAAASESMSDQAQTLRKQVAFFKMNETPEESSNHASFRPKSKTAPVNSTSSSSQTKAKPKPVPTLNKEEWTDF